MTTLMTTTRTALGGALLALALGLLLDAGDARAQAAPETLTLTAVKDSFLRSGSADRNEGANPGLRIQASGNNRVVVGFDPAAIDAFLDANTLTAATLVLTIAENADNWGPNNDRTVDAHPLSVGFAEGNGQNAGVPGSQSTRGSGPGVTWNCAEDAEIANQATDCDPRWNGGTFGPATAPSVPHFNGLSGEVSWDVTDDVLAGASAWLIKKTAEGQSGQVSYFSKEGSASGGPRLILEGQPVSATCGGETSKCVFVTSSTHRGNFGGLDAGDDICNDLAAGEGLPGTYKAWLSTEGAGNSAADRLTHSSVPYKLVTGETVADDFLDLTTCAGSPAVCLQHPIDRTESGGSVGPGLASPVWTATRTDGSFSFVIGSCGSWQFVIGDGLFGLATSTLRNWTTASGFSCNNDSLHLYCFQQ